MKLLLSLLLCTNLYAGGFFGGGGSTDLTVIETDVISSTDGSSDLGSISNRWQNGFINALTAATVTGSTVSGGDLTLESTSDGTKGDIFIAANSNIIPVTDGTVNLGAFNDKGFLRLSLSAAATIDWGSQVVFTSSGSGLVIRPRSSVVIIQNSGGNGSGRIEPDSTSEGSIGSDTVLWQEVHVESIYLGSTAVSLTADDQNVTTSDISFLSLSSDNGTASNRTFTLEQQTNVGQILYIEWTGTNAGELVDDSAQGTAGNHRLSATFTPTQYDTLKLISNGTDWVEVSRSAN